MLLNIGCGNHRAPEPWVNVDQYIGAGVTPDVVASADDLPFKDGSVQAAYVGHLLEHLEFDTELPETLREIRRVLASSGQVCFVGPDLDRAEASDDPEWRALIPSIRDGGNRWPGDRHQWLSTATKTLKAVQDVFPIAFEVPIRNLGYFRWPVVSEVEWQFAIVAR
jgi:predicted SAM-dependent methyltransferase